MKALVVDDTKNIRLLLSTCLEMYGYEVKTANCGTQAIEILKSEKMDLIFLDIKLPEISGTEVLRRIRSSGIDTLVVIMTAFATVKNAVECTKLGAVNYLQKPFTAEKIKAIIDNLNPSTCSNNDTTSIELENCKKLIENGDPSDALKKLKILLAQDPSRSETYSRISEAYLKLGQPIEAEKFYKTSLIFKVPK